MIGGKPKLGHKKELAIASLLTEPTIELAAQKTGIGTATLTRWLRNDDFVAAYRQARRQLVESALGQLQRVAAEAVETLRKHLTAPKAGDQIRAALGILDHAVKAVEFIDLVEQVEALKRELEKVQHAIGSPETGGESDADGPAEAPGPTDGAAPAPPAAPGPGPDSDAGQNQSGFLASGGSALLFQSGVNFSEPAGG